MHPISTRLRLRVAPGAAQSEIVGRHGEAWKVRVAEPPENGRANEAVLRLLAETVEAPRASVALVSGHGGRDKIVMVEGVAAAQVERRLASAATSTRGRKDRRS